MAILDKIIKRKNELVREFISSSPKDHNIFKFYDKKCKNFIDYIKNTDKDCTIIIHMHGSFIDGEKTYPDNNVATYHMTPKGETLYYEDDEFYRLMEDMGAKYLNPKNINKSMNGWMDYVNTQCYGQKYINNPWYVLNMDNILFNQTLYDGNVYGDSWGMYIVDNDSKTDYLSGKDCVHLTNINKDQHYYDKYIRFENIIIDFCEYRAKYRTNRPLDLDFIVNLAGNNIHGVNINIVTATCQNYL